MGVIVTEDKGSGCYGSLSWIYIEKLWAVLEVQKEGGEKKLQRTEFGKHFECFSPTLIFLAIYKNLF